MQIAKFLMITMLLTGCAVISDNLYQVDQYHTIPPAYRSGQMDSEDLREVIAEKDIKIVLNLRGEKPKREWYREETAVCRELEVEHFSVKLSAKRTPSREKLLRIIEVLENARDNNKPILIHCMAGADRTSLGSTIARMVLYDVKAEEAMSSFSLWYGHVCLLGCPLDAVIESYLPFEKQMSFKQWVQEMFHKPKNDK